MNWIIHSLSVSEWVGSMGLICFFDTFFFFLVHKAVLRNTILRKTSKSARFAFFLVINKQWMARRVWIIYHLFLAGSTNDTTRGASDPFLRIWSKKVQPNLPQSPILEVKGKSVFVTWGFPLPIHSLDLADLFNVGFWDWVKAKVFQFGVWKLRSFSFSSGTMQSLPDQIVHSLLPRFLTVTIFILEIFAQYFWNYCMTFSGDKKELKNVCL